MKLTLHNPPEGFEAEAEVKVVSKGDVAIDASGKPTWIHAAHYMIGQHCIVLTPKKRKYWRLDPVATFEEATPASNYVSLRCGHLDREIGSWPSNVAGVQWLRVTECEE